jgi:FkbM family methyltransferase
MSERKIKEWTFPYIKSFNTYIDIGAHDGDTSVPFINKFKKIICFEPNPNSFKILSTNDKLECYNVALGDKESTGTLVINNVTQNPEHGSLHKDRISKWTGERYEVEIKTLDSYKFFKDVNFIKIDTEQYEYFVIQGAIKTIKKNYPTIFFENKRNEADNAILLLLDLGYTVRKYKSDTIAFYEGD